MGALTLAMRQHSPTLATWRYLTYPAHEHPLYRWVARRLHRQTGRLSRWLMVFVLLSLLLSVLSGGLLSAVWVLLLWVFGAPVVFYTVHGTVLGIYNAQHIADLIVRWRAHDPADLLTSLPLTRWQADWMLCAAWFNQERGLASTHRAIQAMASAGLLMLVLFQGMALSGNADVGRANREFEVLLLLGLSLWFDHWQALPTACLSALAAVRLSQDRLGVQVLASLSVLVGQVVGLLCYAAGMGLMSAGLAGHPVAGVLGVLVGAGLREAGLYALNVALSALERQ